MAYRVRQVNSNILEYLKFHLLQILFEHGDLF